jgi:phospholipid transport system substrate-binding protein
MQHTKHLVLILLLASLTQASLINGAAYATESTENKTLEAEEHNGRVAFANGFANTVLAIISDQKKSYDDRREILERAFSNSVDIDWIAKFVIGRTWKKANDEQRKRYTELYRKFLTKTYVENFAQNPDKRISSIKILSVNSAEDNKFSVATKMSLTNRDTLNVNYLVRDKEGKYKVLDIAIENVSLITTHRAEFTALASAQGVEGVIEKLDQLLNSNTTIAISMN